MLSALIVVSTLVAYEPIRHNGFVSYDDGRYITENPDIKAGITWQSLGRSFTQPHFFMWHPLTTISHILDWQIFGPNPLGHHLVNVMFHIVNALLLFWILTNITGATWSSAFVAAVFALHPLQVESVAWASERKTVLSGLFWLATIAVYIRYTRLPNISRYILVLLVFGLCIMTKPVVVTLPLVLLLLDYWPLDRVEKVSARRLTAEKIPLLAMSVFLSVMTFVTQNRGGTVVTLEKLSAGYRIANAFISYMRYIGKMIWPSQLAVIYPTSNLSIITITVCTFLFILLSVYFLYIGRRRKYAAAGWLWYVGTLVPVIGLVQSGSQAMANRYMYIPMVGLLIIIAWGVKELIANKRLLQIIAGVSAAIVLSVALILTRTQVQLWQNSLTLFEHTLKITEKNSIAENGYGCALFETGRLNEAKIHFSKAVQISPGYVDARNNLGKVFMKEGKLNEAIDNFNELISRKEGTAEVYFNLAAARSKQGKYDESIKCFNKAIELDPKYPNVRSEMGAVLLMTGRANEAIACLKESLETSTDPMEVYVNLAIAYSRSGNYELSKQNRRKAMELKSDNAEVLNNLAWLLATADNASIEDANKAIAFAQRACELAGDKKAEQLDTLATAYAAAGRFEEAVKTAGQAVDAAKAGGREDLAGEIKNRIELYKAGHRYIQK